MTRLFVMFALLVALAAAAGAASYTIGSAGDYATVFAGVSAASTGDTLVLLAQAHVCTNQVLKQDMVIIGQPGSYIKNGAVTNNAVYVGSTTGVELYDVTFRTTGGDITTANKAMVFVGSAGSASLYRCAWLDCDATGGSGSAIYATSAAKVLLQDCYADSCDAYLGPFFFSSVVDLDILDSVFARCTSASTGGALSITTVGAIDQPVISGCLFTENAATTLGGALQATLVASTGILVEHCTFNGNTAGTVTSGQLYVDDLGSSTAVIGRYLAITGGGDTYAGERESADFDSLCHCVTHGNAQDHMWAVATADTLFGDDPGYLSKGQDRWDYRPTLAGAVACVGGDYMGWLDPQVTSWTCDAAASARAADGTAGYPFATIRCMQGLSENDTLFVVAGNYAEDIPCTLTSRGTTVIGSGGVPRIDAGVPILIQSSQPGGTFEDLKFTATSDITTATAWRGIIYCDTSADTTTVQSCVFESLTRAAGAHGGLALQVDGAYSTIDDCYFHAIEDILPASSLGCALSTSYADYTTVSGNRFHDIDGRSPLQLRNSSWQYILKDNLFVDVNSPPDATTWARAVIWLCSGVGNDCDYRVSHNTFYACSAPDTLSILTMNDDTSDLFMYYNVFVGDTKVFETAIEHVSATPDIDSMAYCVSYGAPFCKSGDIENAGVETLHINPLINSTALVRTGYYQARACDCNDLAGSEFMGWEEWPGLCLTGLGTDSPAGSARTPCARKRRQ